jgi:hypothetical protein
MKINFSWNLETLGIIAPKQHGKTTLTKEILKNIDKRRIFILDSNLEYKEFKNAYIPNDYSTEELDNFIIRVRQNYNILVVLEDVDLYNCQYSKEFKKLLINGSHQNIGVIYTAKRVSTIPKLLLSETKHLFLGKFYIPNDLNYLKAIVKNYEVLPKLEKGQFLYKNRDSQEEKIIKIAINYKFFKLF